MILCPSPKQPPDRPRPAPGLPIAPRHSLRGAGWGMALLLSLGCAGPKPPAAVPPVAQVRTTRLCSGYRVNRQGPRCVRELTAQQARQSAYIWRLVYEQGRVVHSSWHNGRGYKQSDDDGDAQYDFLYADERLVEYRAIDRNGHVRVRSVISQNGSRVDRLDAWGRPLIEDDSAHVTELRALDANGFVREIRFLGLDAKPAKSPWGAYVSRWERDARGLELRWCSYDVEGRPMLSHRGFHCIESSYDDFGNRTEFRYVDENGRPSQDFYGVHRGQYSIDRFGNVLRTDWFGLDGKPIVSSDLPGSRCSSIIARVVDGVSVGGECLNERGEPSPFRPGHAFWRDTGDQAGRPVETRRFDTDGTPVASPDHATVRYRYGAHDFIEERRFYTADGSPGQLRGPAVTRSGRGEEGLLKSERYFDAHNAPTTARGCHGRDFEWGGYRQLAAIACLDAEGRPATDDLGVSIRRFSYRGDGLLDETRYYDTDNQPTNHSDGFARSVVQYDPQGTETHQLLYDKNGQRVNLPRFRIMRIRPPHINKEWRHGNRQAAIARLEEARRRLLAGEDFAKVAQQSSDLLVSVKRPGDEAYYRLDTLYSAVRLAVEKLEVNEVSPVVEIPAGFFLYQRTE